MYGISVKQGKFRAEKDGYPISVFRSTWAEARQDITNVGGTMPDPLETIEMLQRMRAAK